MDKKSLEQFEAKINPTESIFIISVVSEMVGIPVWTLRKLDEKGIVKPKRLGKKTRCYSKNQIKTLNYIYYLMQKKRVNINGIKMIIQMNIHE